MPVDGTRFRLELPSGKAGANAAKALKAVLGLEASGAERLLATLPRTIAIAGAVGAGRERVVTTLGREAIAATPLESVRGDPCATHPRALVTEPCPVCEERRACVLCLEVESPPRCASCRGRARFWTRFRNVRVAILLAILGSLAWTTWAVKWRLHNWARPLRVAIHPVVVGADPVVEAWASGLGASDFADVAAFLDREGKRYGVPHEHLLDLDVSAAVDDEEPPAPPTETSPIAIAAWSFKLRGWAFSMRRRHHLSGDDAEIFVLYEKDGEKSLDRSLAVEKMRVGVVHAFAGRENASWTSLAIAHELLHTLGASDEYGPDGMPLYPAGYAEPSRTPLLPQQLCEVMAGQIAITDHSFVQAQSLSECLVGEKTAREIGWRK